jgi:hypothetical protein
VGAPVDKHTEMTPDILYRFWRRKELFIPGCEMFEVSFAECAFAKVTIVRATVPPLVVE